MSGPISLSDFGSEQSGAATGATVRVADILTRGVPLRWDEAVALVQEVVEVVSSVGADDVPFPAFEDILIGPDGAVTIHRMRLAERGAVAAGRALHALLATADVPVPLRLFVTQANAPETYPSLTAFAEALAYFGRPDRDKLIRAIYERYRHAGANPSTTAPGRPPEPPPLPKNHRDDPHPEATRPQAHWFMPVAAAMCIASLGAVLWFGGFLGDRGGAAPVDAPAAKDKTDTAKTARQGAAKSRANTAPSSSQAASSERDNGASSSRAFAASDRNNRVAPFDLGKPDPDRFSVTPSLGQLLTSSQRAQTSAPEATDSASLITSTEFVVAPYETKDIYSRDDPDVQPPILLFPSLPPPVMVGTVADNVVNRMELVVAPDGSVERVRLVNGPTRMPDMMLLSGAKMWKFAPAVKDGVAVRYRTTVTWSGFP